MVKVKFTLEHVTKAQTGSRGTVQLSIIDATCGVGRFGRGKDPVPIIWEAEWASGSAWTGTEYLAPPGFDPRAVKPVASLCTD